MKQETKLQTLISKYLKVKYPNIIFTSESSGIRVPMGLAVQMKKQRSDHKLPDMIILQPNEKYKGLILELKKDKEEIYLKSGELSKSKHVQEQLMTLDVLNNLGYYATFACGYNETIKIIEKYLKNKI